MDSTVFVDSQYGQGSKFSLRIPCTRDAIEETKINSPPMCSFPKKISHTEIFSPIVYNRNDLVLIVDDNTFNIYVLRQLLLTMNIEADDCGDGISAISKVKEKNKFGSHSKYLVVLMDIELPIMNGYAATKEIKRLEDKGEICITPVIGLTSHDSFSLLEPCKRCGMCECSIYNN